MSSTVQYIPRELLLAKYENVNTHFVSVFWESKISKHFFLLGITRVMLGTDVYKFVGHSVHFQKFSPLAFRNPGLKNEEVGSILALRTPKRILPLEGFQIGHLGPRDLSLYGGLWRTCMFVI